MGPAKAKIASSSTVVFVVLTVAACLVAASTVVTSSVTILGMFGAHGSVSFGSLAGEPAATGMVILQNALIAAFLLVVAFAFRRISLAETPFIEAVPRRLKVASVLLFASIALPHWLNMLRTSFAEGSAQFAVLDETTLFALAAATTIFCLAHVFDYGLQLQRDSDGIV